MDPERRQFDRRMVVDHGSNPVVATIGVVPRAALIQDISPRGVGLVSIDPPPVGSIVPLWLSIPVGTPSRLLFVCVVYTKPAEGELYRIGVAALDEATAEVFAELLESL